jgi:hypothetical protein
MTPFIRPAVEPPIYLIIMRGLENVNRLTMIASLTIVVALRLKESDESGCLAGT